MVHNLVGIDEVGRGCWAGPLVAGAVMLIHDIPGLKDSKKLTKNRRELLAGEIQQSGAHVGLGWVWPEEVDAIGLTESVRLAMQRAVDQISAAYEDLVIDGNYNFLQENPLSRALIKADDLIPAVSAASIVAKVARDMYMEEISEKYPGYGFESHVGYGTAEHIKALLDLGVTELHRKSYKPIQKMLLP